MSSSSFTFSSIFTTFFSCVCLCVLKFSYIIKIEYSWIFSWDSLFLNNNLVHFDDTVDFPNEPETREKSNRSCEDEEKIDHNERVSKIEERARRVIDLKFCSEVMTAIDEEINSRKSTGEKASPPPMIVLST